MTRAPVSPRNFSEIAIYLYHGFGWETNPWQHLGSMPVYDQVEAQIRSILKGTDYLQVNVDGLAEDADLYAAGLNSHATVNLMLSLEEAFDIELPDRLLRRRTFASIRSIAQALVEVGVKAEAA